MNSPLPSNPVNSGEDDSDYDIERLKQFELLPTLYNLLLDLQTGVIKSKDFNNYAGSLRLKLIMAKKILRDIKGINESVESRIERIDEIKYKNDQKYQVLKKFNENIRQLFDENEDGNEENEEINEQKSEIMNDIKSEY